jgi:hypothetical protein
MPTDVSIDRSSAPSTTTAPRCTANPTVGTSNQEVQAAAGLSAPAPEAGADLDSTLILMGAVGVVVLEAMPLAQAVAVAIRLARVPWVRAWLVETVGPQLHLLDAALHEQLLDVLLPPGASVEYGLEQEALVVVGGALTGMARLARPFGTWTLGLQGSLAIVAEGGLGAKSSLPFVEAMKAEAKARGQVDVDIDAEWILADAGLVQARIAMLEWLLWGETPDLRHVARFLDAMPARLEIGAGYEGKGEAGVGLDDVPIARADGATLSLASDTAIEWGEENGFLVVADQVAGLLARAVQGVNLEIGGGVRVAAGYDPDPFVTLEGTVKMGGELTGVEAVSDAELAVKGYFFVDRNGTAAVVGGTVSGEVGDNGERTRIEKPWTGLGGLPAAAACVLPGSVAGLLPGQDGSDLDVGELVLQHEHEVDDVAALEAVIGPLVRGPDVPILDTDEEVVARVTVRVAEDTSDAFPGAPAVDEEEARDRQRALAGVVTGHAFLVNAALREGGAIDAVSLDAAVVEVSCEREIGLEAEVAVGAEVKGKSRTRARYTTETDVTSRVAIAEVAAMLDA